MTARFAYRRPKPPANALAAATPARSPALSAASLPKGSLPAQEDAFKEVSVYNAHGAGRITISIPAGEYEHMASFANESHAAVENACVDASLVLVPQEGDSYSWAEVVAAKAMLELMLKFQGRRKGKPGRKQR